MRAEWNQPDWHGVDVSQLWWNIHGKVFWLECWNAIMHVPAQCKCSLIATFWAKVHLRSGQKFTSALDSQSARWPSRALGFRQHDWWLYSKVRPKSQDKRRKSQASINLTKHQSHWLRWRVKTKTVNLANFSQANLLTKVEVESMAINSSGPLVQAVWLITDISLADGSQTSSEICWLTLKCKSPLPS